MYKEGLDESKQVLEEAVPGISVLLDQGFDISGDEIVDIIGESEAENLLNTLRDIENNKIIPARDAAQNAHGVIMSYEDKLNGLSPRNIEQITALESLVGEDCNQEVLVTQKAGVLLPAAGLLIGSLVTYYGCHEDMQKVYDACMAARPDQEKLSATLECTKRKYLVAGPDCVKDVAVSTAASAAGVAATGYKYLQFGIDYLSGIDLGLSIQELIGTDDCNASAKSKSLRTSDTLEQKNDETDSSQKTFIGKGENNTFEVPEGQWNFVAFGDGMARQVTECIDISGDEDTIQHNLTITSIDKVEDSTTSDTNDSGTEYDYSFSYKVPSAGEAGDYLSVSSSGMSVRQEGDFIYWYNSDPTGTRTYHFSFPEKIKSAELLARLYTFHWSYGEGYAFLYASNDGTNWETLTSVYPPAHGEYTGGGYNDSLPDSLNGTNDIWIKVVLYSLNDEGERVASNTSQFSRAYPSKYPDSKMFELNVDYE